MWIFALIIGIFILIMLPMILKKDENEVYKQEKEEAKKAEADEKQRLIQEYSQSYQRKMLLTKNEYGAFKKLQEITQEKGLIICPKVRLLDLIEPRTKEKTLLYKIQAKHVDFVICDNNCRVKAIIELDDNSHNTQERKERDQFLDLVLTSTGYKVIRTRYITESTLESILGAKEQPVEQVNKNTAEEP